MSRKKNKFIIFMINLGIFILMVLLIIIAVHLWEIQAFGGNKLINLK